MNSTKTITYLLDDEHIIDLRGDDTHSYSNICTDSRDVGAGALFIAIPGTAQDGHDYIDHAIDRGATGIVYEQIPKDREEHIVYVQVADARLAVSIIASRFFGEPSKELKVIGVTGTNGKTTIATLLYQLLSMTGHKTGLISTAETIIGTKKVERSGAPTSPDAIRLQRLLADMVTAGCEYACIEVSSHSTAQRRIDGVQFTGGIFSNITHDHLDFHKTFENYLYAKQAFFDQLPASAFALANIDDENGPFMLQNTKAATYYYGLNEKADFDLDVIDMDITGSTLRINDVKVRVKLPAIYNAYNITAAYGAAELLGIDPDRLQRALKKLTAPPGRFEILHRNDGIVGILDYAHTPDGLEQLLQTIRDITSDDERVITVVGAGGDRDSSKRSTMGTLAAELSHVAIFTADNPRSEEPLAIIEEMKRGLYLVPDAQVLVNPDREEAIKQAISLAKPGDIVVLAGKGHETYQEVMGQKLHFDDKEIFLAN